ncbi:GTP-binding protein [Rubrivivax sp. JA1026]|uniref:GTP-binding protein n=1 Tax=Rubrivivax sp. JA1026 TaxID=2710888 RepID=UPI0013E9901B|nr:GTP-binding protein [Rubrivivax sp. JA1026]
MDVIHRTASYSADDIQPLLKYLDHQPKTSDLGTRSAAEDISRYLRKMGSNDIATLLRGGEGVSYEEVVCDVGTKLKAQGVASSNTVGQNEELIIRKVFADTLDAMSEDEKRVLFRSLDLDVRDVPLAAGSAVLMPLLLRQFGGFATYRFAVIIANMVSRALLGSGLSLATNVVLTRTVGTLLGPIGWIATGAWLAIDLAGPAFRKTVPSVLYIAALRLTLENRISIGVVGDGSTGKDTLIQKVFGLPANADPVAGSTSEVIRYELGGGGDAFVSNYPGFNDYRARVNNSTDEALHHTDAFLLVMDATRGISGTDVELLRKVRAFGKPTLVCLNKVDALRSEKDCQALLQAARKRLEIKNVQGPDVPAADAEMIVCTLDPLPALGISPRGREEIREWVRARLTAAGKNECLLNEL